MSENSENLGRPNEYWFYEGALTLYQTLLDLVLKELKLLSSKLNSFYVLQHPLKQMQAMVQRVTLVNKSAALP